MKKGQNSRFNTGNRPTPSITSWLLKCQQHLGMFLFIL